MTQEQKEKILSKIEKLFRKTEKNGCTEQEAKIAATHAQKLMAQHNLSEEEVEIFVNKDKEDENTPQYEYIDYAVKPWAWLLQSIVAKNFRCRSLIRQRGNMKRIVFLGHKTDSMICRKVFEELYIIGEVLTGKEFRRFQKTHHYCSWETYRKSWQEGFCRGIEEEFERSVAQNALMVIVPQDIMDMKFGFGSPSRMKSVGFSVEAYERGKEDGNQVVRTKKIDEEESA